MIAAPTIAPRISTAAQEIIDDIKGDGHTIVSFLLYKSLKIVIFCDILCLHSEYKSSGGRANVESVQG